MDETTIDPILQENLEDTSTIDPLLPKGDYDCEVVKVTQVQNKAQTGNIIKYELKLSAPATSVTGEPIAAGRRLFGQIALRPSDNYTQEMIHRNLKRFRVACGAGESGAFFPLEQYVGQRVRVKVGFKKPTDEYPDEANEVKGFVEPKKQ